MQTITITRPDDWHTHLRDGAALQLTVPMTAARFARAIVMPNLKPPITTVAAALSYRERILAAIPADVNFEPLMTLYLTESTAIEEIHAAAHSKHVYACKLYPAGATTHSEAGVKNIATIYPVLAAMEKMDLPLLIHGESVDPLVDIFDREKYFIEQTLIPLTKKFPGLRIVLEHITTQEATDFIRESSEKIAATITAHHLLLNRNALFNEGINPHYYCLPILKRRAHQEALLKAAISGHKKFFLGTDSAPHMQSNKENACGCAGVFSAHAAIELYAEIFATHHALDKLEAFASFNGADFYGLSRNQTTITLVQQSQLIPEFFEYINNKLVPLRAGETIAWSILK